jgi:hypothetical protein
MTAAESLRALKKEADDRRQVFSINLGLAIKTKRWDLAAQLEQRVLGIDDVAAIARRHLAAAEAAEKEPSGAMEVVSVKELRNNVYEVTTKSDKYGVVTQTVLCLPGLPKDDQ